MKKLLYVFVLLAVTTLSVSSCTEQEVKPKEGGTSGNPIDPKG